MKATFIGTLIIVALAGCAASAPPESSDEGAAVAESAPQALTLAECAAQRDKCYAQNPLFGLLTCPLQYTQCTVTASNGIPAAVTSAINDTAACARTAATCLGKATNAAGALQCRQAEADCVAAVVDARLPPVVTGTAQCIDDAVSCVRASETTNDVAGCAGDLQNCAVDQAVSALPPAVGTAITDINACTNQLRVCTNEAGSASDLETCREEDVSCVGNALGVPIPQAPIADALRCAEAAADCTLDASSAAELGACADDLRKCNGDIAKQELTCAQKWTQCLAQNPFAFLPCAAALATCTD